MIAVFADSSCESRRGLCGMPRRCSRRGSAQGSAGGLRTGGGLTMPTVHRERGARHHHHWLGGVHRAVAVMAAMFLIAELAVVAASPVRPGQAQAATAPPGAGFTLNARRSEVHPQADQDRRAPRAIGRDSAPPRCAARRSRPEPDPGPAARRTACARSTARATTCSRRPRTPSAPSDQLFPRLTDPVFRDAENGARPGHVRPSRRRTTYKQKPAPSSTRSRA